MTQHHEPDAAAREDRDVVAASLDADANVLDDEAVEPPRPGSYDDALFISEALDTDASDDADLFDDDLDDDDLDDDLDDDEDDDDDDLEADGDDDPDEEDDDEDDDLDDASDEEIDLVVALYREDGQPVAVSMPKDLANDLDEFIAQLRRLPADAGACGMVSIASEFFVICRVRGRTVQVMLSDGVSANDWPIARDVADYLGVDIPDPDDDPEPMGDLSLLSDQGVTDFDLEGYAADLDDDDSDEVLAQLATKLHFGPQFKRAVATPHR